MATNPVDSFRARDEAEVRGYGELLELIYESHANLPLTENHMKQLHAILLKRTTRDERHRGEYKKVSNDVVASHPDGHVDVVFRTATPFDTPRLMATLVEETNAALADNALHPIVAIARFVVRFLAIHPFQDGNGRLSRALTTLLLLRSGYDYAPYASLERIVEEHKGRYYAALRESQLAMRDDPAAFAAWLLFFVGALQAQKRSLETKLGVEHSMLQLSSIQERIVAAARSHGRVTTSTLSSELDLPARTVRYHVDLLVGRGLLGSHGERKGRYYTPGGSIKTSPIPAPEPGTNVLIAEIFERGRRITQRDLRSLVEQHGYDPRTIGTIHGRREAHLRRDPETGESVLTSRGEEIARQYIFARRLAEGPRRSG